jgi:DEAD/DEAH box helicase domain-containing protein
MNVEQFLDFLNSNKELEQCITHYHTIPRREAKYTGFPDNIDPKISEALLKTGISRLYTHQATAVKESLSGKNVLLVTPTASGKSLSYLLPVFQRKLVNPHSRSLFIFPTKALAQDQMNWINQFNDHLGTDFKIFTYDGDTQPNARRKISEAGDFVITNPDMLHAGILPHHTNWIKLFENLEFIIIDELHTYKGVFGSHVANMFRRLLRIADFYKANPLFFAASATIGNPVEHAEKLCGRKFTLVNDNGAPSGEKCIIIYNPPVINESLGIRAPAIQEAAKLGAFLLGNGISTIFFSRSRLRVELLYRYLIQKLPLLKNKIRSYRGGYLPNERRKIEKELREGDVIGVVSTNALELGIDIGMLDVSVSMGYPGSINSLWQQFGRAGRRQKSSLSIMIASSDGTDQYLANNAVFLTDSLPENAMINIDNILIVTDHIKCAAFEIPFMSGERFGNFQSTEEVLEYLCENEVLHKNENKYHWISDVYPANTFGLRTGVRENFVIIDITNRSEEKVIGEVDLYSAPTLIHKDAIYIHQGVTYYVEELLWDDRQARVRKIETDYFTDAHEKVDITVLEDDLYTKHNESISDAGIELHKGEIMLIVKAVMYKKLRLETHENIGFGDIHTPELEMHTQAVWILYSKEKDHTIMHESESDHDLGALLAGVAYGLSIVAPVFVMCDRSDLRFRSEVKSAAFAKPAVYFYDSFPGGLDLSYRILDNLQIIADSAAGNIERCACRYGCPACTGLPDEKFPVKQRAAQFLRLLAGQNH